MNKSALYELACQLRLKEKYEKGIVVLQRGLERKDPYCFMELLRMYKYGGWGREPNSPMVEHLQENCFFERQKLFLSEPPPDEDNFCYNAWYFWYVRNCHKKKKLTEETDFNVLQKIYNRIKRAALNYNTGAIQDVYSFQTYFPQIEKETDLLMSLLKIGAKQKNNNCVLVYRNNAIKLEDKMYAEVYASQTIWEFTPETQNSREFLFCAGKMIYQGLVACSRYGVVIVNAKRGLKLFMDVTSKAIDATLYWIFCAKILGVSKDVYRIIARMVWFTRHDFVLWGKEKGEEKGDTKRIKV